MPAEEWSTAEHALGYLSRADTLPHRTEGEGVLLEQVPKEARRVLDLGTGDGRLLALLRIDRHQMLGVGLDFSEPMLGKAHERFAGDGRVQLLKHDLAKPLPVLGRFDAVVSSFAIHHLEHERKRSLYAEVFELLEPGGAFCNLEHVASPTEHLHRCFYDALATSLAGRTHRIACSTSSLSSDGCASSASTTSIATGSGSRWRSSSASSRPRSGGRPYR